MTQFVDLIARAMKKQGKMRSRDIYVRVKKEAKKEKWPLPPEWQAVVRNTMQRYCKRSKKFCGEELFIYHQKAVWECRK